MISSVDLLFTVFSLWYNAIDDPYLTQIEAKDRKNQVLKYNSLGKGRNAFFEFADCGLRIFMRIKHVKYLYV